MNELQTADYVLAALLVLSGIAGAWRGLLRELIALVAWVVAAWGAWAWGPRFATHLGGVLSQEPYGLWAGRALVLVGLLCLGAALGAIAGHFVRLSIFSGTDRLLGFIFGVLRGAVIAGLLVILCHTLRLDQEAWYRNARLRVPAEHIANTVRSLIGEARAEKLLHPDQASRDAAPAS